MTKPNNNTTAGEAPTRRSPRARRQVQSIYDEAAEALDNAEAMSGSSGIKKKRAKKISVLTLPIYNLPDSVLLHIAGYVENSSRVLLAVALTASSTHWRKSNWDIKLPATARTILEERPMKNFGQYSRVDFIEMGKDMAAKLSDEDVGAALACIGATNEIRKLKLTHCVGISGYGLGSLRTSTCLEQLDLSLVEKTGGPRPNNLDVESKISEADVIPILDSILDNEGSSLRHVTFPKKWRVERSQLLGRFLAKYNRVMNTRGITCPCDNICKGTSSERPWMNESGGLFGAYNFTCYTCCSSYCIECAEDVIPKALCQRCETKHCFECTVTSTCDTCGETTCNECSMIDECGECEKTTCGRCCPGKLLSFQKRANSTHF